MTDELRKLLAAWRATEEMHEQAHSAQDAYIEALLEAAPGLLDTIDRLTAENTRLKQLVDDLYQDRSRG